MPPRPGRGEDAGLSPHGHGAPLRARRTTAAARRSPGSASRCRWSRRRSRRPLALAAAAADFGNGVSRALDFDQHLFVNTDLTVHLHREPAGEWVPLDARTDFDPQGSGLAASVLHDERGPIGLAAQSLYVADRAKTT